MFVYFKSLQNDQSDQNLRINNPYLKEYSLPSASAPNGLIVDKKGTVWISSSKVGSLFSLNPNSGQIKDYKIIDEKMQKNNYSVTMVWTLVQDGDGKIWFSPLGTKTIWRFDPEKDTFNSYHADSGSPFQMKVDKKGEIWFTTLSGNTLGVIQKSIDNTDDYKISTFTTGNNTSPAGLFVGDDTVWVADVTTNNIVQYKVNRQNNTLDISTMLKIPQDNHTLSSPTDLIVNRNIVWLTEHETSFLTKYDLLTGKVTRYPTSQNSFHTTTLPFWIRSSNDSQILWFNEHQGNKIASFEPYDDALTEYTIHSLPKDGFLTYPLNIAIDPFDGKIIWFSEWNTDKVGVINGHVVIPFKININTKKVVLNSNTESTIDVNIQGNSPYNSNRVLLNVSSSIIPTSELGNVTAKFSSDLLDLSRESNAKLILRNNGESPGNYTLGISASDGFATRTIFLDLYIK